jgi:hypothetical protein
MGERESKARGTSKSKCQLGEKEHSTYACLQIALVFVLPRLVDHWHARPRFALTNPATICVPKHVECISISCSCTCALIARPTTKNGGISCKLLPTLRVANSVQCHSEGYKLHGGMQWKHGLEQLATGLLVHGAAKCNSPLAYTVY